MKVTMRDGSGTANLRYAFEDMDRHGNVRVYVQRRGFRKIRLKSKPGTDEFIAEYRAAYERVTGAAPVSAAPKHKIVSGSVRWLFAQYMASGEFKQLSDRTRYVRRLVLDNICEIQLGTDRNGVLPYKLLKPQHVKMLRDAKADAPHSGNAMVKALRLVFAWALEDLPVNQRPDFNPAVGIKYLKGRAGGFPPWTLDDVQKYWKRHPIGTKARLALDLFLFTGVRRSDVIRLGPQYERGGRLCFTEAKGQKQKVKQHEFQILPALRESIDKTPSGHLTYLVTEFGKPFTHGGFGNWFRRRCNEAGLSNLSAHGLRKAGATIAAENGATATELMAIFGWTKISQAETYIQQANRKKLADGAMHKLVPILPATSAK